jgi:Calcineurin-like phosphoesterase
MRLGRNAGGIGTAVAIIAMVAGGCDDVPVSPSDAGADAPPVAAYTIAVLPDTQYYSSSWPDIFMAQTRWLVETHVERQIAFVLHTGDLVDEDLTEQWSVASEAMHALDGQVPYVITAGNHDYGRDHLADRMGMGSAYFPPLQMAANPWFQGTFEPGHIENSFSLFDVPDGRWLVLALEFGPRDEVLAWANQILATFHDTRAIVITHAYLYRDGTRYDHVGSPQQHFNPHEYVMMGQTGTTINDGAEMWSKLVEPNSNVKLVFSGHDVNGEGIPPGTAARLASTRPDGTTVQQVLANYQTCTSAPCAPVHGGNGFLRLLHFPASGHTVSVETYSPYLDQSLTDAANQFTMEIR